MNSEGEKVAFTDKSILPNQFDGDPKVFLAVLFMILGFTLILLLERTAVKKNS